MTTLFNFMMRSAYVLLAFGFAHTASAADALPGPRFVGFVQEISDFEIASGRMALTKSSNDLVRAFAHRMITDHEDAASSLRHNRTEAGVTLAPTPGGREPRHARVLERLAQLQGPEFDAVYVAAQLQVQVELVDQVGAYSQNGDTGGLRRFAQEWLPKTRMHLEHARRLPAP